jgi:hypothetical protein
MPLRRDSDVLMPSTTVAGHNVGAADDWGHLIHLPFAPRWNWYPSQRRMWRCQLDLVE